MDKISLRLSEEEKGALREQADALGVSVSELIRDRLFPKNLAGTPASFAQVAELEKRVLEAVGRLVQERENELSSGQGDEACSPPVPVPEQDLRLQKIERELAALVENFAELKELFLEQKNAPSGWSALFSRRG